MLRNTVFILTLAILPLSGLEASAATTKQLVQHEGWRGLLCCNAVPDCICKYCCPDYCKKPLPKVCCGPLPPNLSCGCGPKRWWSFGCKSKGSCDSGVACGESVDADCGCAE
jgi:hypothetical protein